MLPFSLIEAFDNPYGVELDPYHRKGLEGLASRGKINASSITVWSNNQWYIYELKHNGAWEYHFNPTSLDHGYSNIPKLRKSEYNRVIATIASKMLMRIKSNPTDLYRVYGIDEKMTTLYFKVVQYMIKKNNVGDFTFKELNNFNGPTGDNIPLGYEIKKDTRTLRHPDISESYL